MDYKKFCKEVLRDRKGATAIEYGLIAALIAVAAITGMQSLGSSVSNSFETAATALENK